MAFKLRHDTPDRRALREQVASEACRIFHLPDRFMARALRDLGRASRAELGDPYCGSAAAGYGMAILWTVIPGLALRLGETDLTLTERDGGQGLPEDPEDLRCYVGNCLNNSEIRSNLIANRTATASTLISRDFVNGNPITMALDRVAPPQPDSRDWVARHMREISQARFGHDRHISWSPGFQHYERRGGISFDRLIERVGQSAGTEAHVEDPEKNRHLDTPEP